VQPRLLQSRRRFKAVTSLVRTIPSHAGTDMACPNPVLVGRHGEIPLDPAITGFRLSSCPPPPALTKPSWSTGVPTRSSTSPRATCAMSQPQADIPLFKVFMAPEAALLPRLREVLYSGQISEGAPVAEFEQRFGAFRAAANMLSFYRGTAATATSALLLRAPDQGTEVISTCDDCRADQSRHPACGRARGMGGRRSRATAIFLPIRSAEKITSAYARDPGSALRRHPGLHGRDSGRRERHGLAVSRMRRTRWARAMPDCDRQPVGIHDVLAAGDQASDAPWTAACLPVGNTADLPRGRRLRWFGIDRAAPRTEMDVAEVGYKYHMNNVNAT